VEDATDQNWSFSLTTQLVSMTCDVVDRTQKQSRGHAARRDLMWSKTASLETRSEQAIAPKHRSHIAGLLQVDLPPSYPLKDLYIRVIMTRLVFSLRLIFSVGHGT